MRHIQIWQCVAVHVSFGVVLSLIDGFVDHFLRSYFVAAVVVAFVVAPVVCLKVDSFAFVTSFYRTMDLQHLLVTTMEILVRLMLPVLQQNEIVMPIVDCLSASLLKLPQLQRQRI
jgi:hypothetical protein